jgi:hypothetical protein
MSRSLQLMAGRKTDVRDAEWIAQLTTDPVALVTVLRQTTASSPKDSPEPMIRNVASATDGVSAV